MEPLDIEILELFMQLTEDEQRDALAFAEELVDRQQNSPVPAGCLAK